MIPDLHGKVALLFERSVNGGGRKWKMDEDEKRLCFSGEGITGVQNEDEGILEKSLFFWSKGTRGDQKKKFIVMEKSLFFSSEGIDVR